MFKQLSSSKEQLELKEAKSLTATLIESKNQSRVKTTVESKKESSKESIEESKCQTGSKTIKVKKADSAKKAASFLSRWNDSPIIYQSILPQLPTLLKQGVNLYSDDRQKDVFLLSALTALSGLMPNSFGIYNNKKCYANLFLFLTAPPASGKGVMNDAKKWIEAIQSDIIKPKNVLGAPNTNQAPKVKMLMVPADASSAAIIKALDENNGNLIMMESEADTLVNVLKKDWASYDDLLRKTFHHESIALLRKTEGEYTYVNDPKLSVALSGTPEQLRALIKSPENGLLSRFMYYGFTGSNNWRDVFNPLENQNHSKLFNLEKIAINYYKYCQKYPFEFDLTSKQITILNSFFKSVYEGELSSDYMKGVISRMCLICFRIAMILTALRRYNDKVKTVNQTCNITDFNTALNIVQLLLQHSKNVLGFIEKAKPTDKYQKLLDLLPNKFSKADAINAGKKIDRAERTITDWLKELKKQNRIESSKIGVFNKIRFKKDENK